MFRKILLIIAVLMLSVQLTACTEKIVTENAGKTVSTKTAEDYEASETVNYFNILPSTNYNGATYNIVFKNKSQAKFSAEEASGDILEDAAYKRNLLVSEKFNIDLNCIFVEGSNSEYDNTVLKSVLSGSGAYNVVTNPSSNGGTMVISGICTNLYNLPYFDFTLPYWDQNVIAYAEINNKLFICSGEYTLSINPWCIFFNKDLARDYNIPDLFALVEEGTWTADKYIECGQSVKNDLDGNGIYDENDLWGLIITSNEPAPGMLTSFGVNLLTKNDDGYYSFVQPDEKMVSAYNKIIEIFWNSGITYAAPLNPADGAYTMFGNGNSLFFTYVISATASMRDIEFYGILPQPKFDETQEEYLCQGSSFLAMIIPTDCKDTEMSALVLSALNAKTDEIVTPVYYETVLKRKFTRDNESEKMLSIIFDGYSSDFLRLHSTSFSPIFRVFDNIGKKEFNYMSWWASVEEQMNTELESIIDKYKELK